METANINYGYFRKGMFTNNMYHRHVGGGYNENFFRNQFQG